MPYRGRSFAEAGSFRFLNMSSCVAISPRHIYHDLTYTVQAQKHVDQCFIAGPGLVTSTYTLYRKSFGSALSAFLRASHTLLKETVVTSSKDLSNQAQRIAAR